MDHLTGEELARRSEDSAAQGVDHLRACPVCRSEMHEYRWLNGEIAQTLAAVAEGLAPPSPAWAGVADRIRVLAVPAVPVALQRSALLCTALALALALALLLVGVKQAAASAILAVPPMPTPHPRALAHELILGSGSESRETTATMASPVLPLPPGLRRNTPTPLPGPDLPARAGWPPPGAAPAP